MKAPFKSLLPRIATIGAFAGLAVHAAPSWAGDLEVAIEFETASESHYAAVTNTSRQFLCVAEDVFDTTSNSISLNGVDGEPVPRRVYTDSAPTFYRGVDLAKAYVFLKPGERRKIYIDLTNFKTREGAYEYRIVFPYYACKDIIDTGRSTTRREIATHAVNASGRLEVFPRGK